jgi:hypothetical protein
MMWMFVCDDSSSLLLVIEALTPEAFSLIMHGCRDEELICFPFRFLVNLLVIYAKYFTEDIV